MNAAELLVVEDDQVVAHDLELTLTDLGYQVIGTVDSAESAIRVATDRRPDLVLMDIRLGGQASGLDAADTIRQRLHLPIVYVTAYGDEATLRRAERTEPFGYILKPYNENELRTTIDLALYRHRAEQRLRRSEERYRALFDDDVVARFVADGDGRLTAWNRVFARLLALDGQGGDGALEIQDLALDRHQGEVLWRSLQEDDEPGFQEVELRRRPDGERFHVLAALRRDVDADGAVELRGHLIDVTARRQLEERLHQVQRMETVGRLAGGVAHDFNNLLTAILGHAELVAAEGADERTRQAAEQIRSAAQRASSLTRQLLAYGRREDAALPVIDLNRALRSAVEKIRPNLGADIALRLQLGPQVGNVRIDPSRLEQILVNLSANARDAMPDGGTLDISTTATGTSGASGLPAAALTVEDGGRGIDPAALPHVFEPYFTTKGRGLGTGLGLSTVYALVQGAGGAIDVASEAGRGTRFRILFPTTEAPPDELPATCTAPATGGSETVLVVEDEDAIRGLVEQVLADDGYVVRSAPNAEAALRIGATTTEPIHLLLTDVVMPGMDGRALARRFRALHPESRLLYISGYASEVFPAADAALHARLLPKPFRPIDLLHKVREVLEQAPQAGG